MKYNKSFLYAALSLLTVSSLVACSSGNNKMNDWEYDPDIIYDVGDTVKEWKSTKDFRTSPLDVVNEEQGTVEINKKLGNKDKQSLHCLLNGSGYITSQIENPFFTFFDAKDGDKISLYVYIPSNSNLKSISLDAVTSPYGYQQNEQDTINGTKIDVSSDKENEWIQLEVAFNTIYTLGSIRVNYEAIDESQQVEFYVDDINITFGEETISTNYVSNGESLYKTYEDYFIVGGCMSAEQVHNTKARKVVREQFSSITAENEGKPEHVLDQAACQALANKTEVAIKTDSFEDIYDWCYANNIRVRHHTFVWYSQTPDWFFNVDYSNNGNRADRATMLKRMENFIKVTLETINERWPGLVYAIDVANEALQQSGIRTNNNKWYDTVGDNGDGDNFVYYAFKYASMYKEEDQDLYYNDYEYDYNSTFCDWALNNLLKKVIDENLIDGVGIQGHIDDDQNMDHTINNAKLIKAKGLKCQITELDLETRGNDDNKWQKQKDAYQLLIKRILENNENEETDINAVIIWGITDNASWKRSNNPILFDENYTKKPAYYGFLNALEEYNNSKNQ